MQRWIIIGVVAMILLGVGGAFGLWTYKQNRPDRRWIPIPLNTNLSEQQRLDAAKQIKEKLLAGDIVLKAATDTRLAERLKLSSHEEAAQLVRERLFVEVGDAVTPAGRVPSLNIGMNGKRKEMKALGDTATHLMKDVFKILGIDRPQQSTF